MTATAALAAAPSVVLTEAGARALTDRIATQLEHLDELLLAAWRGRIWAALDYPTWDAWVTAELGTVRLRLPVEQRRAVTAAWRAQGMSQRAIATGLGVSKGTVAGDLADGAGRDLLAVVVSLDGRRRPAVAARPPQPNMPADIPAPRKQTTALEVISAVGEHGVTVPELMKELHWTWSQASACASRLNRALDDAGVRGLERLAQRRGGHAIYVVPAAVAGREVLEPGQRLPRSA